MYDLNNVPRPQTRAPLRPMASAAPSNTYDQAVAVPRKNDPVELAAPAPVPAAASASMRIKLPDPPLTAEDYYARAASSSRAIPAAKPAPVKPRSDVQASGGGYTQKVVVPRKNAPPVAVAPAADPAAASASMSIKLPTPPKTAEEYYSAAGSKAQHGRVAAGGERVKMRQKGNARPEKAAKFPSLKSRYAASGAGQVDREHVAPPQQQQTSPHTQARAQAQAQAQVQEEEVGRTEVIASQEESNALAQKAVSTISEVASDIAAGFGTVRSIHIHINAPVEVHIHQAKVSSKL